jgi:hypothetical protein
MTDNDNVRYLPNVRVDRVAKLASTIVKVMQLSELNQPEEYLTALLLVQEAIQQGVMQEEGPAGLRRVLIEANERRKKYRTQWVGESDKEKK